MGENQISCSAPNLICFKPAIHRMPIKNAIIDSIRLLRVEDGALADVLGSHFGGVLKNWTLRI